MRQLLSCIISFILVFNSSAQYDSASFIIESAIRSRKNVNKIIYIDSSIRYYRPISYFVKKGKLEGYKDTTKVVVTLSQTEIKFLDAECKKAKSIAWNQNMFENSIMVSQDSINIYFSSKEGWTYFKTNHGMKYFSFSKPVLIRNNSIAIFRLNEWYRPSAGSDLLFIYQKIAGKWQQLMYVYMGSW